MNRRFSFDNSMTFIRFNYVLKRRDAKTGKWLTHDQRVHLIGDHNDPKTHEEVLRRINARMAERTFKWAIDKVEYDPLWKPSERQLTGMAKNRKK